MKIKVWHRLGVALLMVASHFSVTACSSSDQQAAVEEGVDAGDNAAADDSGDQGDVQENAATDNSGNGAEENAAADNASGNEGMNNEANMTDDGATDGQAQADAGEQQGDLQDIIQEMNAGEQSADAAAPANVVNEPAAGNGADAAATADMAAPANAAPANAAPANAAAEAAPANNAAAATPAPAATADASGLPEMNAKMSYIVQKGDTLVKIATKVYGDHTKWSEIASFTGMANPKLIYPGDVVYYQLTEQTKAFAMAYESVRRSEVQVQQGDTLSSIASRVLGSTENWKMIWRQNDSINDPDVLTVGTTIFYVEPSALAAAVDMFKNKFAKTSHKGDSLAAKNLNHKHQTVTSAEAKNKTTKSIKISQHKTVTSNNVEAELFTINYLKSLNAARII